MNHYGICEVSNDSSKSYLTSHNQYVSINGFESGLAALNCGVPQGSVLGPLLFLLYINDLNQAIKFWKVHHFAVDTNILCLSNTKKLNKLVNAGLKHLVNWLNTNKISLNVKKTEMVIIKSKQKKFEGNLKIKFCGKGLYPTESVKYLGVKIGTNLSWQYHVNDLSIFQPRNFHTSPLFKQNFILKFQDKIYLENILFVSKSLNNLSPSVFDTWFRVLHRVIS